MPYKDSEKRKVYFQQYRAANPEWARQMNKKHNTPDKSRTWRAANPEKARDLAEHNSLMKRFSKHGLTLDQYHAMAERQDFCCAICGTVPDSEDSYGGSHDGFHIDHDHITEEVRGLLCKHCNVGLGMFKDSPDVTQSATAYLNKHHTRRFTLRSPSQSKAA